jgi:hypothetical protein
MAEAYNFAMTGKLSQPEVKLANLNKPRAGYEESFKANYETEQKIKLRIKLMEELSRKELEYQKMVRKMALNPSQYDANKLENERLELLEMELTAAHKLGSTWEMVRDKAKEYNSKRGGTDITQETWEWDERQRKAIEEKEKRDAKAKEERARALAKAQETERKRQIKDLTDEEKRIEKILELEDKRIDALKQQKLETADQLKEQAGQLRYLALNKSAREANQRAQRNAEKQERRYQGILANAQRKINANVRRRGFGGIPLSESEMAAVGAENARAQAGKLEEEAKKLDEEMRQAELKAAKHLESIDAKIEKLLTVKE